MTADQKFEHLIEPVIGPEPARPLSSLTAKQRNEAQYSFEEGRTSVREEIDPERALQMAFQPLMDLSGVERQVLRMRLGIVEGGAQPTSIRRIASELGMPKSTVFDVEKRAIHKLSHPQPRTR